MSTAHTSAPDAELLGVLARRLVTADCSLAAEPPLLLAVSLRATRLADLERNDGTDAEVLSLAEHDHPLSVLCHTRARPSWTVAGLLVDGWTLPRDSADRVDWRTLTATRRISEHPARRRVRTLFLVSRGGASAIALQPGRDGDVEVHVVADGAEAGGPVGPMPDGLRRLFGLRTPPPSVDPLELWASVWLAAAAGSPAVRTWDGLADLHPGAALLEEAGLPATVEHLVVAGRALARAKGWEQLQLEAVTGPSWPIMPTSDIAAWADVGMFSRLLVREVPPLWQSFAEVAHRLPSGVLEHLHDVLGAWALDPRPPPALAVPG